MTERDELISAYLDGEATADERALVEGDAVLMAEVAEFERLRADLAAAAPEPAVDAFTRRRHLAAALDAFDAERSGEERTPLDGGIDLRAASSPAGAASAATDDSAVVADVVAMARPDRRRRPLGALVAAAAGVIVFAGVAVPLVNGSGDDADLATSTFDASSDAADSVAESAEAMTADAEERASDDEAMEDAMADDVAEEAMEEEAMEDAMADDVAGEAMEEEAMEDDEMEEDAVSPEAESTSATESGAAPEDLVIVDPDDPASTLEQLQGKRDLGIPTLDPACPLVEGVSTLHVAPGVSTLDGASLEVHLHSAVGGADEPEVTIYLLPSCELG